MNDLLPQIQRWLRNQPGGEPMISEEEARALLERAVREGVGGIVASELRAHFTWVDEQMFGWFRSGAQNLAAMEKLAAHLHDHERVVIALKGAALLPTVYSGRVSCRPVSDIDLLLIEGGASRELISEVIPGPAPYIDWHRDLLDSERIPARAALLRLSNSQILEHSVAWKGGVRHLSPELQFVHLALHAFKHSCSRLIWLVDQALVLRNCSFPALLKLAEQVGAKRPVLVALHIVQELFAEPMPPLPVLRWWEKLAVRQACRRNQNLSWGEIYLMLSVEGFPNKASYLFYYFLPGTNLNPVQRILLAPGRFWRWLRNPQRNLG